MIAMGPTIVFPVRGVLALAESDMRLGSSYTLRRRRLKPFAGLASIRVSLAACLLACRSTF